MLRIFDVNDNLIDESSIDYSLGYTIDDKKFVKHHNKVKHNPGKYHYETVKEYPNGGKDVKLVWDKEPVEAQEEYDEYENILRYILYTKEELEEIEINKNNDPYYRIEKLEKTVDKLLVIIKKSPVLSTLASKILDNDIDTI